ncbi:MAG TPA: hypothetical protein DIT97_07505 [Gimesia maris]|uniref:Uncharacterized protein n=1 Tax=Gimesia maris TaxID=122 RepID=A0A3D3R211_9PLAN|nr:hypothetical protein [Gimesia maris]
MMMKRKWWIISAGLLVILAVGIAKKFDLFTRATESITDAAHQKQQARQTFTPPTPPPRLGEAEEQRRELLQERTDNRGRILFPPTAVAEMKIDPELVKGIPWEKQYQPVPLNEVKVTYTENQFQQDRAEWYQNLFLTEYEQHGDREPRWDEAARAFLKEAGRRASIARYREFRSPKFYPDQLDDQLAKQGLQVLDLGCNDPLVISLLIEALGRQKMFTELTASAQKLQELYTPDRYSEIARFQILKILVRYGKGTDFREEMSHSFRKAIQDRQLTSLERRIYLHEGQIMLAPVHQSKLGQFIISLEQQADADPWLKNMILGTFYYELGLDEGMLRYFWPAYTKVNQSNPLNVNSVIMGHLRKSYRLYLQAYQIAPELPETPLKLFRMSFRQNLQLKISKDLPNGKGEPDRLSPASPRYWFDRAIAAQFDFRPMYRQYRVALIPPPIIYENWERFQPALQFGVECLNTERFDTQVPFGFQDAVQAIIAHSEYSRGPAGPRSREVYGFKDILPQMKRMVEGYASHFNAEQKDYYASLLAGINWIQGNQKIAKTQFAALGSRLKPGALEEVYLDRMEVKRSESRRKARNLLTVDLKELQGTGFLSDRSQLMLCLPGGKVQTWDLKTHEMVKEYSLLPDVKPEASMQYSISEGAKYITCYQHPEIKVYETESFSEVASLKLPGTEPVKSHRISNTGKYLVVAVAEQVEIWDVATQSKLAEINIRAVQTKVYEFEWRDFLQHIREICFNADDSQLAFVRGVVIKKFRPGYWAPGALPHVVNVLYVWDLEQQKLVYQGIPFQPNINAIEFTDTENELLISGTEWSLVEFEPGARPETRETCSIKLMNLEEGEKTIQQYAGRDKPLWVPRAFGKDRSRLIALSENELLVWDWQSGRELTSLQQHPDKVSFLLTPPERDRLVTIDVKGNVKLFSGELIPDVRSVLTEPDLYPHQHPREIKFDPGSQRVGVCNEQTGALIWDFSDPSEVKGRLYRASGPVGTRAFDFSPDFRYLATTADTMPRAIIRELQEKAPVSIWDTESGEVVRILEGETSFVESGTFDPTGRYFVSGLKDGNIMVWDLESESNLPVQILKDHVASVTKLKFSPDGRLLLSGGCGGEAFGKKVMPAVKIWTRSEPGGEFQVQQTIELDRKVPPTFGVQDLDLSPDGKWILASCNQKTSLISLEGELRCTVEGGTVLFLPDNKQFITAGGRTVRSISLWNYDGLETQSFPYNPPRYITVLSLFPDSTAILSSSYGEGIKAWFLRSGEQVTFLADLFPVESTESGSDDQERD